MAGGIPNRFRQIEEQDLLVNREERRCRPGRRRPEYAYDDSSFDVDDRDGTDTVPGQKLVTYARDP